MHRLLIIISVLAVCGCGPHVERKNEMLRVPQNRAANGIHIVEVEGHDYLSTWDGICHLESCKHPSHKKGN